MFSRNWVTGNGNRCPESCDSFRPIKWKEPCSNRESSWFEVNRRHFLVKTGVETTFPDLEIISHKRVSFVASFGLFSEWVECGFTLFESFQKKEEKKTSPFRALSLWTCLLKAGHGRFMGDGDYDREAGEIIECVTLPGWFYPSRTIVHRTTSKQFTFPKFGHFIATGLLVF